VDVAGVLAERWDVNAASVDVLAGGMNSAVWLAAADGRRVVVKAVDAGDSAFGAGLDLAERLAAAGLVTGRPVPSNTGLLVERVAGRQVGVLEFVEGVPLTGADASAIGEMLGRVHAIAGTASAELEAWLHLVTQFDEWLDLEPWIRPAVHGALDGVRRLGPLTWAWLHGDPHPRPFYGSPMVKSP
jgi:homoserine kinase type II